MDAAKYFVDKYQEMNISTISSTERTNIAKIESDERISLEALKGIDRERLRLFLILVCIAIIGGASGIMALANGAKDVALAIITGTITGILGILGGKSLTGNGK